MVTILGGIISIAGLLAASFVTTDYAMFLSYSVVWGTGSRLCYASTYVVVGKLFHKHLAFAMGFVTAGSGVGGLAMSPSIERMLEAFGWKTTMRGLGILASCLIIAAITYREPIVSQESVSTKKSWRQLFDCSLWCIPAFSMLTVSLIIFNFGYYIPIIHVVRYLIDKAV
jgi:MFS family permease